MVNGKGQDTGSAKRPPGRSQDNEQPEGDGEQPVKRSRVSRACDQCRASRERCDGTQPRCRTCASQNRGCSYNEQPKKRGIQPNYIRTLELTLAWIFEAFPETEARLTSGLPVSNDSARLLISGKDSTATETLHTAWRECLANKQIEQMLSGSSIDSVGLTVHDNAGNSVTGPYSSPPLSAPSDSSGQKQDRSSAVRTQPDGETGLSNVRYRLPENAWILLEYYFAFTHSWLPMTEKSDMLKVMYSYPSEGLSYSGMAAAEHAELWAIMAVAKAQMNYGSSDEDVQTTRQLVESLLPTGNASFELPHIKALVLLSIMDMQEDRMLAAWLRIGTVVRLLYLFKLLQSLGQTTKWCRHIHLVAFVIESALAMYLNTPGHLTKDHIASIGYIDEDGMEEWSPWQDPSTEIPQNTTRTPARSFSTLNELVRIHMKDHAPSQNSQSTIAGSKDTIVFNLLKNAMSKRGRVQPSNLVVSPSIGIAGDFNWPSDANSLENPSLNLQEMIQPELSQADFAHTQEHPFMSIPNEPAAYSVGTSPAIQQSAGGWNSGASLDQVAQAISPEDTVGGASADIFEELANLERQDSIQHPQFMRNLGFAPDLDLAEFFGADYQPSDPLLAYATLQPSGYA